MPAKIRAEQLDTTTGTISTVNAGDASSEGTGDGVSRRDHQHAVSTATAVELAETNAEGVSGSLSRADHTHDHGDRSGGSLHAAATTGINGFMSAADKTKLDGLSGTTPNQERVTTESIINTDTALTDTLDNTPTSNASVLLLFNGVAMIQGASEDYTISGTTITWLASSGTAPNMKTSDDLVAYYQS